MRNYLRTYIWVFFILLFVIMAIYFLFWKDSTLRNNIYKEGYAIDTIMQVETE